MNKNIEGRHDNNRMGIIETIRGLAALAVCLYHFRLGNMIFIGTTQYFVSAFSFGWLGVEAFFVLSGFIIPYSMVKGDYSISRFARFLGKRCLRIEPPYLFSILLVLLLGYLSTLAPGFRGTPFQFNVSQTLSHLAYLPEHLGFTWLSPVYWSLEAEFHFYILIGLVLPFLWHSKWSLFVGLASLLGVVFISHLYVFSSMPYFVMGIGGAAYKTGKVNKYFFCGILFMAATITLIRGQLYIMPMTGIIIAVLICFFEFRSKITDFLGKISFSLYLIHVPVGGRIINFAGRYTTKEWHVWLVLIVALLITLITSWVFYKLVEYPSQMLSKRISYKKVEKTTDNISALSSY